MLAMTLSGVWQAQWKIFRVSPRSEMENDKIFDADCLMFLA